MRPTIVANAVKIWPYAVGTGTAISQYGTSAYLRGFEFYSSHVEFINNVTDLTVGLIAPDYQLPGSRGDWTATLLKATWEYYMRK